MFAQLVPCVATLIWDLLPVRWPGSLLKGLAKVLLILTNTSLQNPKARTCRQRHVAAQVECDNLWQKTVLVFLVDACTFTGKQMNFNVPGSKSNIWALYLLQKELPKSSHVQHLPVRQAVGRTKRNFRISRRQVSSLRDSKEPC